MPGDDLYQVLGVSRRASHSEVKRAYREIARKFHPDKNPGNHEAESIFKAAAEAYRVLGDKDLREQYDRTGRAGTYIPRADHAAAAASASDAASDIFREVFGTRPRNTSERPRPRRPRPPERGSDLRYTLELDFEDAAFGCDRQISVPRLSRCSACAGTGARAGTAPILCQKCGGAGNVRDEQGFFSVTRSCPHCGGTGKLIPESCPECRGAGEVRAAQTLTVTIPSGVDTGTRLKLSHEGDPGPSGGPRGDLFVIVEVRPHPFFKREEDDVVTEVPIRFTQAALGATIEVPTLDGKVRMRVPPGSQSGRVFRLKGKGIPSMSGHGRGDQRVRVVIEVPEHVTAAQRTLLERYDELAERNDENPKVKEHLVRMEQRYGDREPEPSD